MAESIYRKASLAMIPYGALESELPSIKPTDGSGDFTFSRGTDTATRVNASGLIEKERGNVLLYSNQPNLWSVTSVSLTGGQTGYDGSNDAWLFDSSAGYIRNNLSLSGVYTFSIYAKQGTADGIRLRMDAGTDANVYISLTDGSESFPTTGIDSTATSVGGGWWRISITANDSSFSNFRVYAIDNVGVATTGTIYIQDAMVNEGLVAQPYIETIASAVYEGITDNLPRLDYSGGASCPSLLLEPQRSNLAVNSEYFGGWTTIGTATFTANYGESPEGVQNAYRFEATSAARGGKFLTISVSSGTTYTLSFYAKSLSGTQKIRIGADNGCSTPQDAETFEIGTEWLRIDKTITSDQTSWNLFFDNVESGTACTGTYLDTDLLIYGFQCEAGSYPTSYIPTYGTSATRAEDSCSVTGVSDLIGQTEGTIYLEMSALSSTTGNNSYWSVSDASGTNRILIGQDSTDNKFRVFLDIGTSTSFYTYNVDDITSSNKIALVYSNSGANVSVFVNGVKEQEISSGGVFVSALSKIVNDNGLGGQRSESKVNQALVFPTALTDAECIALTTL